MSTEQNRVPVIDGLRGFAILLVVFFHGYLVSQFAFQFSILGHRFDFHTFPEAGYLGVEVFFFVSGFCLMLPYAQWAAHKRDKPSLGDYISRRVWKIIPSYYLALFLVPGSPADHIVHALFLHGFAPHAFTTLNSNFWSLATEVEFYFIFPPIALWMVRSPALAFAFTALVTFLYSNYIAGTHQDGAFFWAYQLPDFLVIFGFGMLCAYLYRRWIAGAALSPKLRREMSVVAILSIVGLGYCFEQVNRLGGGVVAWEWQNAHRFELGFVLSLFTLSALAGEPWLQRAIANPVLSFYSDISYNMYLWNAPIIDYLDSHFARTDAGMTDVQAWQFATMTLVACTIPGWLLTRYFERPLMRWRGRLPAFRRGKSQLEPSQAAQYSATDPH